uniref:NADH dehydrogenase subunit 4L n=1 Tax=Reinia arborea TaxID=1885794 RepID=A0A224A053_9EUPU|nr:NADH dehydrogenase subunit 4L [Reinia arborea]
MLYFLISSMLLVILFIRMMFVLNHYLSVLILLELLSVVVLTLTLNWTLFLNDGASGFLIVLTFLVAEAALGLAVLLTYIKSYGSDLINQSISVMN